MILTLGGLQVSTYNEYKDLLSKTYDQAVEFSLQKYGPSEDDYFREKSYQRFMDREIKNITKGKCSRTGEGLYCHHIDEKKYLNISNQLFIEKYKYPFESQKKERLVYCDLIEHTILHVLISKETSFKFGWSGYDVHLKPYVEEWYIEEKIPGPEWMKNCYNKSFLEPQDAFNILKEMQKILGENYYNTIFDYYEEKNRKEEVRIEWLQKREQMRKDSRISWIKYALLLHNKSQRQEIVNAIYYLKYENENEYEEFDSKMKIYRKDEILEELKKYLESLP